jgi:hypothetical protein
VTEVATDGFVVVTWNVARSCPFTHHQSCEHVADDLGKIMAALKHPYKELTANIFRAINATINSSATPSQQQLLNLSSTIFKATPKHQNQPTSKGQKEAPKTHDKAIGKRQEWIGKVGAGLLGVQAFFEAQVVIFF